MSVFRLVYCFLIGTLIGCLAIDIYRGGAWAVLAALSAFSLGTEAGARLR